MDRNPFGELQEGQVGSVQFNAPPIEQVPDLTAVNAGQNAQALLVAGRFLSAGADQLDSINKQQIKALNANLKAKGQQLATSGLFDGQTMTAEEAAAAGFTDQSFLEGYLKTRADADLQTVGYELKRAAQNPSATEQSLYALSEQRIGQLKQKYNKFGAIGSTVFSEDVYKPLLTVANEVKLDGIKRDVQVIQADQEVMSRSNLGSTFANASVASSGEDVSIFTNSLQRELDNAKKVHGSKYLDVFKGNFKAAMIDYVNNGGNVDKLTALTKFTKLKLANGDEVGIDFIDADFKSTLYNASRQRVKEIREDRNYQYQEQERLREENNLRFSNLAFKSVISQPNVPLANRAQALIDQATKQGISGINYAKAVETINSVQGALNEESKHFIDQSTLYGKAGKPFPNGLTKGLDPIVVNAMKLAHATATQEFNITQTDQQDKATERARKTVNFSFDGIQNLGTVMAADPNLLVGVSSTSRPALIKGLNQLSNNLFSGTAPIGSPEEYRAKLINGKKALHQWASNNISDPTVRKRIDAKIDSTINPLMPTTSVKTNSATNTTVSTRYLKPIGTPNVSSSKQLATSLVTKGTVSSNFGKRFHPIDKVWKTHTGLDIAANEGEPIKSFGEGKVVFAGKVGGYGNLVKVSMGNGIEYWYAHQKQINVSAGQTVKHGTIIGAVGQTGHADGPHLHFEVRKNGVVIDPIGG